MNYNNIDRMCFADLIRRGQIRIPQIQRDYAQGRQHRDVMEIRNHFVRSLLHVVMGKKSETQLDFVYGSDRNDAFEPLDGQQRLTTLFLLHWVLEVELQTAGGDPLLTYETRSTSEAFCKELVRHSARQFVDEARAKTALAEKLRDAEKAKPEDERDASKMKTRTYAPSDIIRQRDWFQWGWRFDPTISSMLVMIDTICGQMDWTLDMAECRQRLDSIIFNHLDLGEMGMSDELFIKMNARGKLLSDFDKLKSTLEEEIQMQQAEIGADGKPLADTVVEHSWREHMDGKWIDLFWQRHAGTLITNVLDDDTKGKWLDAAKETEKRLKIFLLRMIAMQLFARRPASEALYEATYRMREGDMDNLLVEYQNLLVNWRSSGEKPVPDDCTTINFEELICDMDLWIIDLGQGRYTDVTTLLPRDAHFSDDDYTYFSHLVGEDIGNDVIATLYSMQQFLRYYPYRAEAPAWLANFDEWTRMSRNVFKFDNNTDRINKRNDAADAFEAVIGISRDLYEYSAGLDIDVYADSDAVLRFLQGNERRYKGIDNKSLEEEIAKARLRLSTTDGDAWTKVIRQAERNTYLWGQIRCLIHWAGSDLELFVKYASNLTQWVNINGQWDKLELYYTAMLCLQPDCWKSKNRLYEFNRDRDNSLKRYLREEPEYGETVRVFIETWLQWDATASFVDFCRHVIATTHSDGWVKYFKQRPHIIWQSWRKRIFEDKGHVILAQQKTTDSHCFDPVLLYINHLANDVFYSEEKNAGREVTAVIFHDSKSAGSHGLFLSIPGHTCEVSWGEMDGEYVIAMDGRSERVNDIDTLVSAMSSVIAEYDRLYKETCQSLT